MENLARGKSKSKSKSEGIGTIRSDVSEEVHNTIAHIQYES